jgi:uncharacterized membrane protein
VRLARPREVLLGVWLIAGFLLLYIPTDFQIKMLVGWQVPVAIYATRVVLGWLPSLQQRLSALGPGAPARAQAAVVTLFVLAVLPVNVYLYAWRFVDLARRNPPYYLHRDELAAMQWLEANARPSDVVMSSLTAGQYLPSVTGTTAFLAHWAQTLQFYDKRELVARFFDARTPESERLLLLARYGVRYVFYGEEERRLGEYNPEQSIFLSRAFFTPRATIYYVGGVNS